MKCIYTPLFAAFIFLGCTALVAENGGQARIEALQEMAVDTEAETASDEALPGWPREYRDQAGEVIVYQPQLEEWIDYTIVSAKAAVSVQFDGSDEFHYGVVYFKATTEVDKVADEVLLDGFTITRLHFPNSDDDIAATAGDLVTQVLLAEGSTIISLDTLVADLESDSRDIHEVDVNLDPPPIFYSDQPALLLTFMGDPSFKPVDDVDGLMFAINTNWDLLLDVSSSTYYLLNEESWIETADPVKGPWENTQKLPDSFSKLPDDNNWGDVKEHIPGKPAAEQTLVFVATEPSELIETDGAPEFGLVSGTRLMYVSNTDSEVFFDNEDKNFYFLTAGRWFRSEELQGPWSSASADLPEEFGKIPEDHKLADVLSAVPGTPDAEAAVLLASVPQKATVSRKDTTTEIIYEGEPEFKEIKGTTPAVYYGINSPNDVFRVSGLYYAVVDGVWFVASGPTGPWAVAIEVDEAIYSIPEESPKYNATYVRVYDSTPDNVVVGYTSGYSGSYVAATGVLMFGLGLLAGSYWGNHRYRHYHYHSHYYGYGSGMRYRYGHGYYRGGRPRLYGPHGGIGGRAGYNPGTGRYYRGGHALGPYGSAFTRSSYSPYTNHRKARTRARTPYGSWGKSVVSTGSNWKKSGHRSRRGKTTAGKNGSYGRAVSAGYNKRTGKGFKTTKGKRDNLFVGKDGDIYKQDKKGWSKHSGKDGWKKSKVKLDVKDRKTVKNRKAARARKDRIAGTTARKDHKPGKTVRKDRKTGTTARKDHKPGATVRKDRKTGTTARKDHKPGATVRKDRNAGTKKQPKQRQTRAKSTQPKAATQKQTKKNTSRVKPTARKQTKKCPKGKKECKKN